MASVEKSFVNEIFHKLDGQVESKRTAVHAYKFAAVQPRCVARPFDGHLTLIDRSTWRDGAFNRADSARAADRSLVSDALSAVPARRDR